MSSFPSTSCVPQQQAENSLPHCFVPGTCFVVDNVLTNVGLEVIRSCNPVTCPQSPMPWRIKNHHQNNHKICPFMPELQGSMSLMKAGLASSSNNCPGSNNTQTNGHANFFTWLVICSNGVNSVPASCPTTIRGHGRVFPRDKRGNRRGGNTAQIKLWTACWHGRGTTNSNRLCSCTMHLPIWHDAQLCC